MRRLDQTQAAAQQYRELEQQLQDEIAQNIQLRMDLNDLQNENLTLQAKLTLTEQQLNEMKRRQSMAHYKHLNNTGNNINSSSNDDNLLNPNNILSNADLNESDLKLRELTLQEKEFEMMQQQAKNNVFIQELQQEITSLKTQLQTMHKRFEKHKVL